MRLNASSIGELYRLALAHVLSGHETAPRGMRTREEIGVVMTLTEARNNLLVSPRRKLNHAFGVAEWLWILSGRNTVWQPTAFNAQIAKFSDDGTYLRGAYGPKVTEQLPYILETLRRDPDSRQAVLTIWRERPGPSKDVPCTVALQFFLRQNRLHALTYMRSNDLWLGFPYDVFVFTQLQAVIAAYLGVEVGMYHHHVGSLHLYEEHWAAAVEVANERVEWVPAAPPITTTPPRDVFTAFERIANGEAAGVVDPAWDGYLAVLRDAAYRKGLGPYADALPRPWFDLREGRTT